MFGFGRKKKKTEVSKGGSTIYRHEEPKDQDFKPPESYCVYMEEVCEHFDKIFPGRESRVMHEILSDLVHIDVHVMMPTAEENFRVIYTTGMSDLPMTVSKEVQNYENWQHAELVMLLPDSWNPGEALNMNGDTPHKDFWAISGIKYFAKMPHYFKTWLGDGHTIPNGPDYEPILEGSEMGGVVLIMLDSEKSPIIAKVGKQIHLLMVVPITRAETEYKLEHGMAALLKKFDEHNVPLVIDMGRKSVV